MTTAAQRDRAEAIERLRMYLEPGDTVHTILRHRSASGMTRTIQLVKVANDPERGRPSTYWLGYNAAAALGQKYDRDREGVKVSGCGMDMGFYLVYELGAALWPDGFECAGDRCPSNDHSNGEPYPHEFPTGEYGGRPVDPEAPCPEYHCGLPADEHPTKPQHHNDGGYALRHEWL